MTIVMAALGAYLYSRLGADLLGGIDMELRARAQVVAAAIAHQDPALVQAGGNLIDPDEAFAQVLDSSGRIVDSSPGVATAPMLSRLQLASASGPALFTTHVQGVGDPVRLLSVRQTGATPSLFVVVGATLGDRNDALARLVLLLAIAGPLALVVVSWGGWLVAGAVLRPVERMRIEAEAIFASEPDHRLAVPSTGDELTRLASTLNAMLDRVHEAAGRDQRFLDQASHELRTPVTVLKAELDVALSRPRSAQELEAALRRASAEADRLRLLADDLLALSRSKDGGLPVRRTEVVLADVVADVCAAYEVRARSASVRLSHKAPNDPVHVDAVRVRQAIEDLLDNALRYGSGGGVIEVSAERRDGVVEIAVQDSGPGFDHDMLQFGSDGHRPSKGVGLGLVIVRAIAEAHGGTVTLGNRPKGGARVTMLLRT
jgi:signal transduction histidine kinase